MTSRQRRPMAFSRRSHPDLLRQPARRGNYRSRLVSTGKWSTPATWSAAATRSPPAAWSVPASRSTICSVLVSAIGTPVNNCQRTHLGGEWRKLAGGEPIADAPAVSGLEQRSRSEHPGGQSPEQAFGRGGVHGAHRSAHVTSRRASRIAAPSRSRRGKWAIPLCSRSVRSRTTTKAGCACHAIASVR